MQRHATLALCLFVAVTIAGARDARAQMYPTPAPVPRTTSLPDLHEQALQREVHERFRIGLDALDRGQWSGAAAEFERLARMRPREPQGSTARYDLALAYAHLGRLDDAAGALRDAIVLDPGFLAAMANLIAIDVQRGDLAEARKVADRFVALAPKSARALYARGIVAINSGDYATARDDFGKLLSNNPSYALAHYDLGVAEAKLGHDVDAERDFNTALQLVPTYAQARVALGTVLLRDGRRDEARAAFDRAARDAVADPTLENLAVAMRDAIH